MVHCQEYFCQLRLDDNAVSYTPSVLQVLQDYHSEATKFSLDNFSALNQMVLNLNSPRELQQWSSIWQKCQQTKQQLEEALAKAATASMTSKESALMTSKLLETQNGVGSSELPTLSSSSTLCFDYEDEKPHSAGPFSRSQFQFPPESGKLSTSTFDDTDSDCTIDSSTSCHSEPLHSPASRQRKQPLKKIMKKTMSYELTARDKAHQDAGHHGYTGIYIKGLEVTNNVCIEKKLQRPDVKSPALGRSRSMSSPPRTHCRHSDGDVKTHSR